MYAMYLISYSDKKCNAELSIVDNRNELHPITLANIQTKKIKKIRIKIGETWKIQIHNGKNNRQNLDIFLGKIQV